MLTERALRAIAGLQPRPDVLLITGDLTDCGLVEEYEVLARLLGRCPVPVLMVPGNHDRRDNLRRVFAHLPGMREDREFIQCVVEDYPVRLIGLDTVVAGAGHGALCDRRLDFLQRALADGAGRPAVIFMHHPPFDCGLRHMDDIRLLEGAERFVAILRAHPEIERVLCGHHHRPIQVRLGGTIVSIAPSVAHQVEFDLDPEHRGAFNFEPPAYQLHLYTPQWGVVSHTVCVERYPGPFPFLSEPEYPGKTP